MSWLVAITFIATLLFSFIVAKVDVSGPDGSAGTISFGQDMNDEGDFSEHMPDGLKCDACVLLAMKFTDKFKTMHKKQPSVKIFKESEVIHATDAVCEDEFKDYGLKQVNGVNRLSGPGLEVHAAPGVMQGGGKWPSRLMQMCRNYLGELGEDVIYHMYHEHKELEKYLCHGSGVRAACSNVQNQTEQNNTNRRKTEL